MSNNEMVSFPRELGDDLAELIAEKARICGGGAYEIWEEICKRFGTHDPLWNPSPAQTNLAALLILLAQSGVKVSGGIGDEPWSVEPAAQPVPPAGVEPEVLGRMQGCYIIPLQSIPDGAELVDRVHVTRLQAENKRLDLMVAQGDYNRDATVMALRAELDALKAQGQGEPVAWQMRRKTDRHGSQWTPWKECCDMDLAMHSAEAGKFNRFGILREFRPLYDSPPAPVAVVLPERLSYPMQEDYDDVEEFLEAWSKASAHNACLDEVARLNK